MEKFILSLDQGTTNSRAIIFNKEGNLISEAQKNLEQIYPRPGEVEHDPQHIWDTQLEVAKKALSKCGLPVSRIASIGISNQRETTILWNKENGQPLHNAIVWQCRRTTGICNKLKKDGWETEIRRKTGLVVDPYFSGTKIKWILDNKDEARKKAERGKIVFGNVDTWLIWKLTGGRVHATDYTNASRTLLYNIRKLSWDEELLEIFDVPGCILPEVKSSSEIFGETSPEIFGREIPIAGVAGDQQAALFGQNCFDPGMTKNTYGTGSFMLMNTGDKIVHSKSGLITTIAAGIEGEVEYALEGSVFITGGAVQWLIDGMEIIDDPSKSETHAHRVDDSGGVYVVPAFSGLGAPYWDPKARGLIIGITRGTKKEHIIRATLESIAYQVYDVLRCMENDSEIKMDEIRVDGGATSNNFLMQFQSDILDIPVVKPEVTETTALGAAFLAGLAVDYWDNRDELRRIWRVKKSFEPRMREEERKKLIEGWKKAVTRSMNWIN